MTYRFIDMYTGLLMLGMAIRVHPSTDRHYLYMFTATKRIGKYHQAMGLSYFECHCCTHVWWQCKLGYALHTYIRRKLWVGYQRLLLKRRVAVILVILVLGCLCVSMYRALYQYIYCVPLLPHLPYDILGWSPRVWRMTKRSAFWLPQQFTVQVLLCSFCSLSSWSACITDMCAHQVLLPLAVNLYITYKLFVGQPVYNSSSYMYIYLYISWDLVFSWNTGRRVKQRTVLTSSEGKKNKQKSEMTNYECDSKRQRKNEIKRKNEPAFVELRKCLTSLVKCLVPSDVGSCLVSFCCPFMLVFSALWGGVPSASTPQCRPPIPTISHKNIKSHQLLATSLVILLESVKYERREQQLWKYVGNRETLRDFVKEGSCLCTFLYFLLHNSVYFNVFVVSASACSFMFMFVFVLIAVFMSTSLDSYLPVLTFSVCFRFNFCSFFLMSPLSLCFFITA